MKRTTAFIIVYLSMLSLVATIPAFGQKAPDTAENFYRNNTVKLICVSSPGGATDFAARTFGAFWKDVTGGTILVENIPGGGGLVGLNQVYGAEPDGLTLAVAVFGSHMFIATMLNDPVVKFDIQKFSWVGGFGNQPHVFALSSKSPAKTMEDAKKIAGFKAGTGSPTFSVTFGDALVFDFWGFNKPQIIPGLRGGDISVALGRGELDGYVYDGGGVLDNIKKGFVKSPPLVNLDFVRSEWFKETPAVTELIKLSSGQERLLKSLATVKLYNAVVAPPGVPADRLQFMRNAFDKMMAMESFREKAKMRFEVLEAPIGGKDLSAWVEKAISEVDKKDFAKMSEIAKSYIK